MLSNTDFTGGNFSALFNAVFDFFFLTEEDAQVSP